MSMALHRSTVLLLRQGLDVFLQPKERVSYLDIGRVPKRTV